MVLRELVCDIVQGTLSCAGSQATTRPSSPAKSSLTYNPVFDYYVAKIPMMPR